MIAKCWTCGKEHDITCSPFEPPVLCDKCGGYVVSPSGKTMFKLGEDNESEEDTDE